MATDVDTLVNEATMRATVFSNDTIIVVNELLKFINQKDLVIDTGAPLDLSSVALPPYKAPPPDTSAMPVYENPQSPFPTAPVLADVGTITLPAQRTAPTLNTSGLFQQVPPSTNLPDFQETEPDLHVDDLVAEMAALTAPTLTDLEIPNLSPLNLNPRPSLNLPAFAALNPPDEPGNPEDYAARMGTEYDKMHPMMQAFINDTMANWVAQYVPEYDNLNTLLTSKVTAGMEGTVLPDQIEAAMYTRAQGRAEREFDKVEQGILNEHRKFGLVEPPGVVRSRIAKTRVSNAAALANQSTDIYIDRKNKEVQHLQFTMQMATTNIQGARQYAVQYAQLVGNTLQNAVTYASEIADKVAKLYEHLIARAQLRVAIMQALNAQYEIELKAALSALDGYRLELEAAKLQKDVEMAQVQFLEASIRMEELKVQRYSAMIDAITKKGEVEKLKLVGYQTRANIFEVNTNAKVAAFGVYKAAIEGDTAKLEGEKTKLSIFNAQLESDKINLESQMKAIDAVVAANESKVKIFEAGADVYKVDLETALSKFQAQAEIKKLYQTVYTAQLGNAIEVFKSGLEIPKILMNAMVQEYTLRVETALKEAQLNIEKLKISEEASAQAADALKAMAAAALGSLNTMVSSALSASA